MASGVHAVSPQNLLNIYNAVSKEDIHYMNNFMHFNNESDDYFNYHCNANNYMNNADIEGANESLRFTQLSHQIIVNCCKNNNNNVDDQDQNGCLKHCSVDFGCDDYESGFSCTSKNTIDNNNKTKMKYISGRKNGNKDNKETLEQNTYQLNLYQPIVNYCTNKSGKQHFRGPQRNKYIKHSVDTEHKVQGLMKRFKSRTHKLKVGPSPVRLLNGGPWDPLNQAIWDIFAYKIQKEETYIEKLNLWKTIFLFFKMCLDNYGLYLVGSTMSGFALEGSDIDICLLTRPFSNEPRLDSLHHLQYLQHALLKNGLASQAELIMAKVPILKFKNDESGFDIDLNCNNGVGIQNTRLLYSYSQMDWRVRPLVVIVKIWAQANNINNAKSMTISSYSWTLMVIHYLQCGVSPPVLPCLSVLYPEEFTPQLQRSMDVQGEIEGLNKFHSENNRCLGDLLIGFFHYYSYFNYQVYAISVRTGTRMLIELCKQGKSPKNDPHQWKYLCIEEPFDLSNTARSVYDLDMFKHIKHVISSSYKELACNKDLNRILPLK